MLISTFVDFFASEVSFSTFSGHVQCIFINFGVIFVIKSRLKTIKHILEKTSRKKEMFFFLHFWAKKGPRGCPEMEVGGSRGGVRGRVNPSPWGKSGEQVGCRSL